VRSGCPWRRGGVACRPGTPQPSTSTVNWFGTGQAIGNQSTTAVSLDRSVTVTVGGGHSTQFVLDVVGYLV
jgi:hypothetical protein